MSNRKRAAAVAVFKTEWFSLEKVPAPGSPQPYYRLSGRDSVEILAVTPQKKILMVRQFRPALGLSLLELPAGVIDKGESLKAAALRELREETGYAAGTFVYLGAFYCCPSRVNSRTHAFFATNARRSGEPEKGIETVLASRAEFEKMALRGKIQGISSTCLYGLCKLKGLL